MYNTYVKLINLMTLNDCTKWSTGEGVDRTLTLEPKKKKWLLIIKIRGCKCFGAILNLSQIFITFTYLTNGLKK
jgi:hypothetical protein